jgi:2-amino-4-hydroxy-6-hydroxymethyldihydropteridine diphosphokinase
MSEIAYLSLGSNVGDRQKNLRVALEHLRAHGSVRAASSFFETEPVELTAQPWFLNCAVALKTTKMPQQLMDGLLAIEREMGRRRSQAKGPRVIDIDILLFGNCVVDSPGLIIPHPAMQHRRFVLAPLVEIASEVQHPILKKSARELLDALDKGQVVRKLP